MFEYKEAKDLVGKMLKIDSIDINDQDNLIELGINSLKIMRLVSEWRKRGAKVTFAQLISNATFEQWWQYLSVNNEFDNLTSNVKLLLPEVQTKKQFELTDVQYAYWVGRKKGQVLGDIGCHAYLEINSNNINIERLSEAWKKLLAYHPALRTRFTEEGKQEVLDECPYQDIHICDLRGGTKEEVVQGLEETRKKLSHRKISIENGENAGLTVTLLPDSKARIHFDVDLLAADVQSFQIILRDLAILYQGKELSVNKKWSFNAYLDIIEKQTIESKQRSKEYWEEKIVDMPLGPKLPFKKAPKEVEKTVFKVHKAIFSKQQWENIKQKAAQYQITPAMVFLTIYCEVLERWSEDSRFLVNLPIFNRHTEFEGIEDVVADFSNILLLDVDFKDTKNFSERALQLQKCFHNDIKHSEYSGIQISRELAKRYPEAESVAPIVFACNLGEPLLDERFRKTFGELEYMVSQTPQVWIDFQMFDYDDGLYIRWDAVDELFPEGMMDQMFGACCEWIEALSKKESNWQQALPISPIEDNLLKRHKKYNREMTNTMNSLLDGFFNYADKYPDKIAVVQSDTGESLTYKELAKESLKVASYLKESGVKVGEVVAISMTRGIQQVVGILGILASGACYTPIAINQPYDRRNVMYQKSNAQYVLTNHISVDQIGSNEKVKALFIEDSNLATPLQNPESISEDSRAYIIFTSGSSGEPKGVEISHAGAINTIEAINEKCKITDSDVMLAVSSLEFDLSVYDIFGALNVGAKLVCIPDKENRNADYWVRASNEYQVTIWNSVPILFDMLLVTAESSNIVFDSLRWVFLSGDWIGLTLPVRMKKQAPCAKLLAMGGATEASIWSNYYQVELPLDEHWKSIPYGYPLSNQKYCIMDDKLRPCADWVPGELWIGGKGLALSYVGEPELTAEKFITYGGERWYRTGDLGRYWSDGKIEFLGRKDFQVKIRGHRIELGEIENALLQHAKVRDAIILAKDMPSGQKELLAFIVPKDKEENVVDLKLYLKMKVPEYMIPEHYIFLEQLPLNQNGKVDRKSLLMCDVTYEDNAVKEAQRPATEIEKILVEIWKDILKNQEIYLADSYFKLGGDSLIATQLSAKIRAEFKVKFMLEHVFQEPILSEQAIIIEKMLQQEKEDDQDNRMELPIIQMDQARRFEAFPLTEIQKAYWIGRMGIYDLGEVSTHYYFEIENEEFDISKFKKAFHTFLTNHDMMRAVILKNGEEQVVLEALPPYTLREYHFEDLTKKQIDEKVEKIRKELSHRIFEPEEWPLFDIRLSVLPNKKVRLHFCFDNIIFDGWSIFYFFNEINKMYNRDEYSICEPKITFRDYVLELEKLKETPAFEEDKDYWMKRLPFLPSAPELPVQESAIHTFNHLEYRVSATKWERIKNQLMNMGGITPSVFLITAYAEILATWSRHQKFTVNLTRFNRMQMHPNINEVVGDFTLLTLLEIDMQTEKSLSFLERCQRIQKQLLKDLDHSLFGGVQVQRELGKLHQNHQGVLMPVVFTSSLGLQSNKTESKNWFENRIFSSSETPQVWLDHQVTEEKGSLVLIWDYVKELFPEGMINEMFDAYTELIDHLYQDFNSWQQQENDLISNAKIKQFEKENQETIPYSNETLVSLFERQCIKTPQNIALIHCDEKMTYEELANQVDMIAAEIVSQKNGNALLIGIFMEKGMEQVIGALAIMKAGFAYLPLDIHHPAERIGKLLESAEVDMVLSQSWIEKDSVLGKEWIDIDSIHFADAKCCNFESVHSEDTAYVIYTSGSTGEPKGVTITHESVVNTILDINTRFNVNEKDRSIALSNLNFDLSVYDIFGLLSVGGAVVILEEGYLKNPAHWITLLEEQKVSIWNTVPTFMNMLTEFIGKETISDSLRLVLLSGDWIPLSLPEQVKRLFPDSLFVSLGGATEASIWSNYYIVDEISAEWKSIPYGIPLGNQTLYIYNERLQACPCGVSGDLYIGGKGVAVGYWKDEKLTNEQFIQHPITKERIYKTGDLARYMRDGNIEFLGREDNQVKIRGFRIGLGEIESAIRKYSAVKEAVVLVDLSEQKQLHAFITPDTQTNDCDHDELQMKNNVGVQSIYSTMILDENKSSVQHMLKNMTTISLCAAADMLRNMGILRKDSNGIYLDECLNQIEYDQRYRVLIEHWLEQLKQVGAITQPNLELDYFEYQTSLDEWSISSKKHQELMEYMGNITEYYRKTKDTYMEVLKGKRNVISLFVENDFMIESKKLNDYQQINQYYYDVVCLLLKKYTQKYDASEKIAILELGTRFGSMLDTVSKSDMWEQWAYTYSDESKFFLQEKEKQYKDIRFEIFDFNKPVENQEISSEKYHIVLADNTLHRARNLDTALQNIKQLLMPEGVLIFIENTRLNCFDLNVAGLYEYGFSQFTDERQNDKLPFLEKSQWINHLNTCEMEMVDLFSDSEEISSIYGRYLYVAKAKENSKAVDTSALIEFLSEKLPEYMVPNSYRMSQKLPTMPNGKIDRKKLLDYVQFNKEEAKEMLYPENDVERLILELWKEILQLDSISVEENFFEIGGDSLLAIQCMNRLTTEFMIEVSLQDIFSANSLRNLADRMIEKGALNEDTVEGEI